MGFWGVGFSIEAVMMVGSTEPSALKTISRSVSIGARASSFRDRDGRRCRGVTLFVADSGPGVPDAVIERMFNPFFTTRSTGTGLGLAIVHRIVDAHGGRVRADNNTGGGATVELLLPLEVNRGRATEGPVRSEPTLSAGGFVESTAVGALGRTEASA